jgi:histone acetyltransferase (RNA polymerase elongator complex component)
MPDEAALVRGIAAIFQECFELRETNDDTDLHRFARQMLQRIQSGESETSLRQLAANAQLTLHGAVRNDRCREVVHHARRLVRDYLSGS